MEAEPGVRSQLPWDQKNPFNSLGSSLKNLKADIIRYLTPLAFCKILRFQSINIVYWWSLLSMVS